MLGSQRNSSSNLLAQNKTTSKCAACGKTVYPMEKISALDKEYHKGCFKCDTCKMTLTLSNYKGAVVNGQMTIFCNVHYPKEKSSQVPDKQMETALTAPKLGKESGIQKDRRKTFVSSTPPVVVNNNNAAKPATTTAPATTTSTSTAPATTTKSTTPATTTQSNTNTNTNNTNNNVTSTKESKTEQTGWTAVKPSATQSDQDAIEELKRQIEETKTRLAIYEEENPDRKSETVAEDKKRIKKIFDMYDTDRSGSIDAYELQVLAYQLGETLTIDEVRDLMKSIDTDGNGTIEFDEFFNWWIKQEDTPSTQSKASSANTVLHMKLQSKAYLRTIAHLGTKHTKNAALKTKVKSDDDSNLSKFSVDINVGQVTDVQANLRLGLVTDAAQAQANRTKFGAKSDTSLFTSFVLGVKPGVDDFKLGEISGVVKGLLYVLQEALGFDEYKTTVTNENGRKQYVITIHVEEDERVGAIAQIIESLNIKNFQVNADFGNLPSKGNASPIFKGGLRLEAPRDSVEFLKELFEHDQDAEEDENENSTEKGDSYFVQLLKKLMNVRLALSFVDLNDLMQQTLKSRGYDVSVPGWQSVPTLLKPFVKGTLNNPDLPGPVADFYFSLLECFEGIDQIVAQIGDHIIQFESKGFPLFSILPNKEVLDAEDPVPEEEEEEDYFDDEEDDNPFGW